MDRRLAAVGGVRGVPAFPFPRRAGTLAKGCAPSRGLGVPRRRRGGGAAMPRKSATTGVRERVPSWLALFFGFGEPFCGVPLAGCECVRWPAGGVLFGLVEGGAETG